MGALYALLELLHIEILVAFGEAGRRLGGGHGGDFIVGKQHQDAFTGDVWAAIIFLCGRLLDGFVFHGRLIGLFHDIMVLVVVGLRIPRV